MHDFLVGPNESEIALWVDRDRREEARVLTDDPASMGVIDTWISADSQVRILDVSRHGLKLGSPIPVMPGVLLRIHLKGATIIGEVRHCTESGGRFHLGVLNHDVFPEQ